METVTAGVVRAEQHLARMAAVWRVGVINDVALVVVNDCADLQRSRNLQRITKRRLIDVAHSYSE